VIDPREHPMVALSELLTLQAPNTQVDESESYAFAGVRSFGAGVFAAETKRGGTFSYRELNQVRRNQLVYPKLMAWEGAVGIVPADCDGLFVSPEFCVFTVSASRSLPAWLGLLFQFPMSWRALAGNSTGTNVRRRRLYPDEFLSLRVPLPDLGEQKFIVDRLLAVRSSLADAALAQARLDATLKDLVVALHLELSTEDVPWSDLFMLHEEQVAVTPAALFPHAGLRGFGHGLFPKDPVQGRDTSYRAFNRLYAGALVISQVKGWEGAVAVVPDEFVGRFVSPEYRTFKCVPERALPEYVARLATTSWFHDILRNATHGAGGRRERTRPEKLALERIAMPSVSAQRRAVAMLDAVAASEALRKAARASAGAVFESALASVFAATTPNMRSALATT
jgi:type I restriction enzyme S subunit